MERTLIVSKVAPIGKICNGRLITRDAWDMALKNYKRKREDDTIYVTVGVVYSEITTTEEHQSIDQSKIVGTTGIDEVGLEEVQVIFTSEERYNMTKQLVDECGYKAAFRMMSKARFKQLSDQEMEYYETDRRQVNELYDIDIICIDLIN